MDSEGFRKDFAGEGGCLFRCLPRIDGIGNAEKGGLLLKAFQRALTIQLRLGAINVVEPKGFLPAAG